MPCGSKNKCMKLTNLLLLALLLNLLACQTSPSTEDTPNAVADQWEKPRVPDWHKNATIYEVNLRHYTEEGTFADFQKELPRLKEMGIDILWFMPIHEISVAKRKGELGSPYAVKDYKGVNPDFGTMENFKTLLAAIHEQGMYCIIDWVPNHTGWDNVWITEHPNWYTQDEDGNIIDPIDYNTGESWGWTDVADLNYDVPEMRLAMIDAMAFWVKDIGVDGFRVDVAHGVPIDFWDQASDSLYAIEPLFMLAEAAVPEIVNSGAFIMDYGWEMHHLLNEIAKTQGAAQSGNKQLVSGNLVEGNAEMAPEDRKTALDIDQLFAKEDTVYTNGYKMQFTSNHDENSWAGTEFARMGDGHLAFAVLTATFGGMPLVYTGQESAMDKQLEFFKKDKIEWGDYKYADFYKTLFDLKHRNQALWNGDQGGELIKIPTGKDEYVYAFQREKNGDKVVAIINLSSSQQAITLEGDQFAGAYKEVFKEEEMELSAGQEMTLEPWAYMVYSTK